MNLRDLIDGARTESQDVAKKHLWSDEELVGFFNEAVDEVCVRARSIEMDDIELPIAAQDPYADIPEYLWSIQSVKAFGRKLLMLDRQMLDACEGDDWESRTGTPVACYEIGGRLRLYPIPDTAGEATVHAFCTPDSAMEGDDDEPQGVKSRLHRKLIDWALHRAYSKKDADTFDANLAAVHEARFDAVFGPRPDEKAMRRLRINVRRYVKGTYF